MRGRLKPRTKRALLKKKCVSGGAERSVSQRFYDFLKNS